MSELYHYGVKGMRWGIRRDPSSPSRREVKREVKRLDKSLRRTGQDSALVTMATISKITSSDYDQLSRAIDNGSLWVKAELKKNFKDRSVDVYLNGEKNPTIRVQMKNGQEFAADFLNKADEVRYNEFVKYYNERHR